jgi:Gpi18-like mannosyltransferase
MEMPTEAMPSQRASLWLVFQAFSINRLVLIVVSFLTGRLFYDVAGGTQSLGGMWHRWDVLWYVRVADHGYHWIPPPAQSDLAFFPLYPLTMHLITLVTPLSSYTAGLLVTNVSFVLALYLLHRLVLLDFDRETADRAVIYLALFPTALFFFAAYAEALYLACCLGCVYALRLQRWWVAGACGLAATLTREPGVLLLVPFVMELYAYVRREHPAWRMLRSDLLSLAVIPAGLLAFIGYLQVRLGDGLLFLRAQQAWGRSLAPPWQGPLTVVNRLNHFGMHLSPHTRVAEQTLMALDLAFLILFVVLGVLACLWLRRSYAAYTAVVLLAILMTPVSGSNQPLALMSDSRFMVTIFPPFIVLGVLGRGKATDRLLLSLSLALLVLFTNVFVRGRWIA